MSKAIVRTSDIIIETVRQHYQTEEFIPLHAPCLGANEKAKINCCIDSTFVSSVGQFVSDFEHQFIEYTGARHAVAVVNGTMGLFLALKVLEVQKQDLVLTQSLTFVATPNAIKMLGAEPLFLDVNRQNYGMSIPDLSKFLDEQTEQQNNQCIHKVSGRRISACVPMHTLGFVGDIEEIVILCHQHNIKVVEDAAESLGSFYGDKHSGTFADIGLFSFNGNKIITTGGGGMLITNNKELAERAHHLSTTAKKAHPWLFEHDEIGFNLRMPNINAALGVAQFEQLTKFLEEKRNLAAFYQAQFHDLADIEFMNEPENNRANFWLCGVLFQNQQQRDAFLESSNQLGVQSRPLWTPMHQLDIYKTCYRTEMFNTEWLAERIVNIPSGVFNHD